MRSAQLQGLNAGLRLAQLTGQFGTARTGFVKCLLSLRGGVRGSLHSVVDAGLVAFEFSCGGFCTLGFGACGFDVGQELVTCRRGVGFFAGNPLECAIGCFDIGLKAGPDADLFGDFRPCGFQRGFCLLELS